MLDAIIADKCRKLFACEGGPIIGHDDLGESMSGEDQPKFLNSSLRGSRVHHMSLYPLGVGVNNH